MTFDLPAYARFAAHLRIPSRDQGIIPFDRPFGTQLAMRRAVAMALEEDVHDLLILKGGRQIGGSTEADALTLYWLQTYPGMVGQMVSDDLANMRFRRKLLRQMLASLSAPWRYPINADNQEFLEWGPPCRSTLVFDYAGLRTESNLGRSKGLNYLYADEVGSWPDQQAVSALEAALSERHPNRLYLWISTARGFNTFKVMWDAAKGAIERRRVFIAWWQHQDYQVGQDTEMFRQYGQPPPAADERTWINVVRKRYGHRITPEQLAWFRWRLAEKFFGDETMMAQEFSCIPEDAFQAFGDKFIEPRLIQKMRLALVGQPTPEGLRYEWGPTLDQSRPEPFDPKDAPLLVWEEPDPLGVYVVSGHPGWSSSPEASKSVAQVWRVWPDKIVQVAEYAPDAVSMYQFAWALLHLAGAYRMQVPCYFIIEVGATGFRVLEEIQLMERHGYGLSSRAKGQLMDLAGSVQHYYYYRPDNVFARSAPIEWKTHGDNRPWLLHGLRDAIERGHMTVRSARLVDELAMLRRGEQGDNDQIAGASESSDARVICAALSVECWQRQAMGDLEMLMAKKDPGPEVATTVQQRLVQRYLSEVTGKQKS